MSEQFAPVVENWPGQRIYYTTSKSFDDVVTAVRATTARFPDVYTYLTGSSPTAEGLENFLKEAEKTAEKPSGFFLFFEFPHTSWFKVYHPEAARVHKFVIGNPLALKEMMQYDVAAGLNAPWNFILQEALDEDGKTVGTRVIFDLPSGTVRSSAGGEALQAEGAKLEEKFKKLVASWL